MEQWKIFKFSDTLGVGGCYRLETKNEYVENWNESFNFYTKNLWFNVYGGNTHRVQHILNGFYKRKILENIEGLETNPST